MRKRFEVTRRFAAQADPNAGEPKADEIPLGFRAKQEALRYLAEHDAVERALFERGHRRSRSTSS